MAVNRARIAAAERQAQALRLRSGGGSYAQIAQALGYSGKAAAWHAVQRGLERTIQEPAEQLRKLESMRLDELQIGLWPQASKGDVRAVGAVLAIMERRARLLGLDAPVGLRHEGAVSTYIPITEVVLERPGVTLEESLRLNGEHSNGSMSGQ